MPERKRLILEIAVGLLLVLIAFAAWSTAQRRGERQDAELRTRHESAAAQMTPITTVRPNPAQS